MRIILKHKKSKAEKAHEKRIVELIDKETKEFMRREDVAKYLEELEKDKARKQKWDSLSTRQKIKVLRYVANKRQKEGGIDGKK